LTSTTRCWCMAGMPPPTRYCVRPTACAISWAGDRAVSRGRRNVTRRVVRVDEHRRARPAQLERMLRRPCRQRWMMRIGVVLTAGPGGGSYQYSQTILEAALGGGSQRRPLQAWPYETALAGKNRRRRERPRKEQDLARAPPRTPIAGKDPPTLKRRQSARSREDSSIN
jgi:hypothetical protein